MDSNRDCYYKCSLSIMDNATAFKQMFTLNRSAYPVKGRWETSYVEVP